MAVSFTSAKLCLSYTCCIITALLGIYFARPWWRLEDTTTYYCTRPRVCSMDLDINSYGLYLLGLIMPRKSQTPRGTQKPRGYASSTVHLRITKIWGDGNK